MKNMNGSHCATVLTITSTQRYLYCPSPQIDTATFL